jgi:hypothetical protein
MDFHLRVASIASLISGIIGLFSACLIVLLLQTAPLSVRFSNMLEFSSLSSVVRLLIAVFLSFMALLALPNLAAGLGLMRRREWGRALTVLLSAVNLLNFPLGTVLGGYILWVLLSEETEPLFGKSYHRKQNSTSGIRHR